MRIEIRASGGHECPYCRSHELLHAPEGNSKEEVAQDIADFIEQHCGELERGLVYRFEQEKLELGYERKKTQENAIKTLTEQEERMQELLGSQAPFYRPFKKAWQAGLLKRVSEITDELREKTARA